jgi:hypothetical protein
MKFFEKFLLMIGLSYRVAEGGEVSRSRFLFIFD